MHDPPDSLVIVMLAVLAFDPKLNPAAAIGTHIVSAAMTRLYPLNQNRFPGWLFPAFQKAVISAA